MKLIKQSFLPLISPFSKTLILGSLPSEISLAERQYYGNKRNQFWSIMGDICDKPFTTMNYEKKITTLLQCHFSLWDVVSQANREGSLDSQIRNAQTNDIKILLNQYPNINRIAFNGKSARKLFRTQEKHIDTHKVTLIDLPSSSPAYTLAYDKKRVIWKQQLIQY